MRNKNPCAIRFSAILFLLVFFTIAANTQIVKVTQKNYLQQGWEIDEVYSTTGSAVSTATKHISEYVNLICNRDDNTTYQGLGSLSLSVPKKVDNNNFKRIRFKNNQFNNVPLSGISVLEYSTYIVSNTNNMAPILTLQIDVNGDGELDININYEPRFSGTVKQGLPWQAWNALTGRWWIFADKPIIPYTSEILDYAVIQDNLDKYTTTLTAFRDHYPNARIINTTVIGDQGGGIRFTAGAGSVPTTDWEGFVGYLDAFKIAGSPDQVKTTYDFENDCLKNIVDKPWNDPTYRFFMFCALALVVLLNSLATYLIVRHQINKRKI